MKKISYVIPCYNSEQTIESVIDEITNIMIEKREEYEIILVNDCSRDSTWSVIQRLHDNDEHICGISLAKNSGQHGAVMAGLHYVSGDVIVCADDDGQTPLNEVYKLLNEIQNGHDVVYANYSHKMHSGFRNLGSYCNDLMARWLLNKPRELVLSSYFAAKRFVIDEIIRYTNPYPYLMGLVLRTTQDIVNVPVNHRERAAGRSGYSFFKLISLWMNGFTSFSVKPLRLATGFGVISAFLGFVYGIYTIIRKIIGLNYVMGFSALVSINVFFSGIILITLGILGEYMGRLFISSNNSPQYVIRDELLNNAAEKNIIGVGENR